MKQYLAAWTLLLLVPTPLVWAEDEKPKSADEVTAILRKVDAAARAVKAVKYDVTAKGTGFQQFELEGQYIFAGLEGRQPKKMLATISIKMPGSSEVQKYTGGTDGENYFVIDHKEKKAYVDIDPAVWGTRFTRAVQMGLMIEFVYATPFTDEINAKSKELKGSKTVGGVECVEIDVIYQNDQKATWYFGKKDHLPRKRVDTSRAGSAEKTLTNLVADPKIDDATFAFKLPEGYTQVDDFAP